MDGLRFSPTPPDPRRFGVVSVAGRRPANEDAWSAHAAGAVACYIVADGVGGQERGAQAATTTAAAAARAFDERRAAGDDPPAALLAAVAAANEEVYRLAQSLGVERMGCTLVLATAGGGRLDVAHVGDARAWLLRAGRLFQLTRDHTWVQEQVDRGTITPADAAQHELRHIVTRVLGNGPTIEAALSRPAAFEPGDRLLLSTDGLHDVVDETRLARLLVAGAPPEAARALVEAALAAGSEDNVTALVVVEPASVARPPADPEPTTVEAKRPRAMAAMAAAGRPVTAPGQPPPRRRTAVWPALAGGVGLLFVLGMAFLLLRDRPAGGPGALPTAAAPAGAATRTPASAATPSAAATSTVAPTGYPVPTETAADNGKCMVSTNGIYLYLDEQAADTARCHFAYEILRGEIIILDPNPRDFITYPGCFALPFVRVQSVADPGIVGWVSVNDLDPVCREGLQ